MQTDDECGEFRAVEVFELVDRQKDTGAAVASGLAQLGEQAAEVAVELTGIGGAGMSASRLTATSIDSSS